MPEESRNFVTKNWSILVWIVAAIFASGGIYSEFTSLQLKIKTIDGRLDKKIKVINDLEERIITLEKQIEYERGYSDGIEENE